MMASAPWKNLLSQPNENDHIVQTYKSDAFLVNAVTLYLGKALNRAEAVIVIATADHWKAFESRLLANNIDIERALLRRQLMNFDAAQMLSKFMVNGMPDWNRFRDAIGAVIDLAGSGTFRPVRAYGEMVNLLWLEGNANAAIRLEEMWNDLGKLKPFSLFCAYTLSHLDKNVRGGLPENIFDAHSHIVPGEDYLRFEEAVTRAFVELVEPENKALHALFDAHKRRVTRMPEVQSITLWIKEHIPHLADKVIDRAKQYYVPDELQATA